MESAGQADCLLAVNSPGKHMIESEDQAAKDITFSSYINMHELLQYICYFSETFNRSVGLDEVSACKGCENEFMDLVRLAKTDEEVESIGSWNTVRNTIGTVLAYTVIAAYYKGFSDSPDAKMKSTEIKLQGIVTDWLLSAQCSPVLFKRTRGTAKVKRLYYSLGKKQFWEYILFALFILFFYGPLLNMTLLSFAGTYQFPGIIPESFSFKMVGLRLNQAEVGAIHCDLITSGGV
ncbi:MAG: DUF4127 family protein [Oscillospiraceae bacterium]|nr:DUF4127 family protein [Oscillospiraceae bacterium]